MQQLKRLGRERIAGFIIILCLALVTLTILGIKILDVKVENIEIVDQGLFTVITENGPVNVHPEDILRIERTYTKAAVTGAPVELDKIYTTKGFIYATSNDSFASVTRQLMNSVDFYGLPTWERSNITWQSVQPYAYAIGTPPGRIPILFFLLTLQYLFLSLGGIALAILIFPLRWNDYHHQTMVQPNRTHEQEYRAEEQLSAVAK